MRRRTSFVGPVLLAVGACFAGVYAIQDPAAALNAIGVAAPGCEIKGNVSIDIGERIYHVPGQKYYAQTRIAPEHGERWFCSEAEARAAGWWRSRV